MDEVFPLYLVDPPETIDIDRDVGDPEIFRGKHNELANINKIF